VRAVLRFAIDGTNKRPFSSVSASRESKKERASESTLARRRLVKGGQTPASDPHLYQIAARASIGHQNLVVS
jgi:hypothetical protein